MKTLYGLMVTRNEQDRWLEEMLIHSKSVVDHMFVFDDNSSDETALICAHHGATTVVRAQGEPSFMENEGLFRQCAWNHFRERCAPQEGDWVFALDADEFPVPALTGHPRVAVQCAIDKALQDQAVACQVDFKEIWNLRPLQYRVDGFWDTIKHPRLFAYVDADEWNSKRLGGGSWPEYVAQGRVVPVHDLVVLHYGYATDADKAAKYDRYSAMAGSHSNKHINSILSAPTLVEWTGGQRT